MGHKPTFDFSPAAGGFFKAAALSARGDIDKILSEYESLVSNEEKDREKSRMMSEEEARKRAEREQSEMEREEQTWNKQTMDFSDSLYRNSFDPPQGKVKMNWTQNSSMGPGGNNMTRLMRQEQGMGKVSSVHTKSAAGGALKALLGRIGAKAEKTPLEFGVAPGNAMLWDTLLYDDETDPSKRWGMGLLNTIIGVPTFRAARKGSFGEKQLGTDKRWLSGVTGATAEPLVFRGFQETVSLASKLNRLAGKTLEDWGKADNAGTGEKGGDKLFSDGQTAALLGLAAVPAGVYAWDKLFGGKDGKDGKDGKPGSPDPEPRKNVALEIPSSKISDGFYNSLGREVLFGKDEDDRGEKERKGKKASVEPGQTPGDSSVTDDPGSLDTPGELGQLDPGARAEHRKREIGRMGTGGSTLDSIMGSLPAVTNFLGVDIPFSQNRNQPKSPVYQPSGDVKHGWGRTMDFFRGSYPGFELHPGRVLDVTPNYPGNR